MTLKKHQNLYLFYLKKHHKSLMFINLNRFKGPMGSPGLGGLGGESPPGQGQEGSGGEGPPMDEECVPYSSGQPNGCGLPPGGYPYDLRSFKTTKRQNDKNDNTTKRLKRQNDETTNRRSPSTYWFWGPRLEKKGFRPTDPNYWIKLYCIIC